jgi:hypothetical protein
VELDWLSDDINKIREKIVFRDRTEYRVKGVLHNISGPAFITAKYSEYYIKGKLVTEEEWNILIRKFKLKRLLNNIKV